MRLYNSLSNWINQDYGGQEGRGNRIYTKSLVNLFIKIKFCNKNR